MSQYRFIAFPPEVAPTAKEVRAFRGYAEMLNDRVAFGKQRDGAGLAICCQAEPFDHLRGLDPKFAGLLKRWEKQGARVVESLPFSRDKLPWREIEKATKPQQEAQAAPPPEQKSLKQKHADAQRAEAMSRLEADREQSRAQAIQRLAALLPYALWAVGGLAVVLTGVYLANRLPNSPGERRAEAIERIAGDALGESLEQQPLGARQAEQAVPEERPQPAR